MTDVSRGIGLAIERVLAQCGADVIGVGTAISGQGLAAHFEGQPSKFAAWDCDLSDREQINRLIAECDAVGHPLARAYFALLDHRAEGCREPAPEAGCGDEVHALRLQIGLVNDTPIPPLARGGGNRLV